MARADDPRVPTLIHPRAVSTTSLPAHTSLQDPESSPVHRPSLPHFLYSVLTEGHLLASTINDDIFVAGAPRRINDVDAKIQVYKRPMRRDHQPLLVGEPIPQAERWFGRQSDHRNANMDGTVMYGEFKRYLKNGYVDWKAKYVPDVVDTNKLFEYDCQGLEFERFRDVTASVHVLTQKASLTYPRTYLSLIITAAIPLGADPLAPLQDIQHKNLPRRTPNKPELSRTNPHIVTYDEIGPTTSPNDVLTDENEPGFLVVQIPLQKSGIVGIDACIPKKGVMVPVAAVEFIRRMTAPDDGEDKKGRLEWTAASSAGATNGVIIPLSVMRGSVFAGTSVRRMLRDTKRFVRWVCEQRRREQIRREVTGK